MPSEDHANGSDSVDSSRDSEQSTLLASPELQVVEAERDGFSAICPDCGKAIGKSRGGHELPDGRRVHGLACSDCNNVIPGTCHAEDAPHWTDRIRGIPVEMRDGSTRLAAGIRGEKA
ncbi:hypothetical protein [Halorarius halobius]|uniref:hypothetical protein n=1 Tax=Halorarius halobius TaxID=2962671 RepID=UPI0020CF6837|nr:hypothetical protein [Halorarius halobius]